MTTHERLWKSPEGVEYMVQGLTETGKWTFVCDVLYTLDEATNFMHNANSYGYELMRVVRVSRYLPSRDADPVAMKVEKVYAPEKKSW